MCGGIGYSLYLHTILLLLPKFLFSPKGFREYPNHEKIKEKVKKRPKKERMEKPGKLAELVAPESAASWRDFMEGVAFALLHQLTCTNCIVGPQ